MASAADLAVGTKSAALAILTPPFSASHMTSHVATHVT